MKKLLFIITITVATISAFAQQIKCGGFSPSTIVPGETSKYTIILENLRGSIDYSAIPLPKGLKIVGTSTSHKISIVNGRRSSQTELIYMVHASEEGKYTIREWHFEHNNKKYTIDSATLIVDKNATPQQEQEDEFAMGFPQMQNINNIHQAMRQMMGMPNSMYQQQQQAYQPRNLGKLSDHITLKLHMPQKKIYVGEALNCKLVFSYSKELANAGFKLKDFVPQINKSDAFDCILLNDKFSTKNDGEKNIISYDILVTPLKAGTYNLDFNAMGIFLCEVSDGFFSRVIPEKFETSTEDKQITVSELPQKNKPTSFNGAIGKFNITSVNVQPQAISEGEPCVVSLDIIGMGNFARVNAPQLEKSPDWKIYGAKTSFTDESNGMKYSGIKNFRYTIVPKKPDLTKTPQIEFSYFDPEKEQYQTIKLDGQDISVAPISKAKPTEQPQKKDDKVEPNFEKIIDSKDSAGNANLLKSPLFWIIQLLILLIAIAFIARKSKQLKLANDPIYAKRIKSQKQADYFLKKAEQACRNNDTTSFLENAHKAVQNALAANTDIESDAILLRQAKEIMNKNNFSQDDIDTVSTFFTGVDAINYGGLNKASIEPQLLIVKLKKIHSQLK